MGCPEKAIPHFQHALEKAADNSTKRLKGSELYNLGMSYFHNKELAQAITHFNDSIRAFKERGYEHLNRILDSLIMLSKAYLGTYALNNVMELSEKLKDHVLLFKFLRSLYVDNNFEQLEKIMELLEIKSMYTVLKI